MIELIFLIILICITIAFLIRINVVHRARMKELDFICRRKSYWLFIKQLQAFDATNRNKQIFDLRKWTHKQFFGEHHE